MKITLKIWRQRNAKEAGKLETYQLNDVTTDMSFLEMMDILNQHLIKEGKDPVAFDHDCREGICGMCSMVIQAAPLMPMPYLSTK